MAGIARSLSILEFDRLSWDRILFSLPACDMKVLS